MKKYIIGAVLSILVLVSPALTQAQGLTTNQASSLIAVVQSAPGVPASTFVNLITSFSSITVNQATSLIAVVQAAPGVAPNAFVNLLISFTSDTSGNQATTPATNQAVTTQPTQWTIPTTQTTTTTQSTNTSIPNISSIRSEDGTPINPGDMVVVYGTNLYGNPFTLDDNYGTPVSQQDSSGSSFSFVVPWNTSVGTHTVQIAQKGSGTLGNSVTFTVVTSTQSVSALPVISSISPFSAKPGDLMYVYGSGLYGNPFSIDENPVISLNSQATDGTSVSFWLPLNLIYGRHVIKVEQKGSGVAGTSILFDIVTQ